MTKELKQLAISFAAHALNFAGGAPFSAFYGGIGHILMFHRVQREISGNRIWANAYLEVTTDFLEEVIIYFRNHGYYFASLDEIAECIAKDRSFVSFTFDDGFRDNLELAYPVLARHGVPMSVFVATGFPEHSAILWWNEIERLLLGRKKLSLSLGDRPLELDLSTPEQKQTAFRRIAHHIRNSPEGSIADRLSALYAQFDIDPHASVKQLALSWDEVKELSRLPKVTIGAHTINHPVLSRLDDEACRREIAGSKSQLQEKLGQEVSHFAYPFGGPGDISARHAQIACDLGFKSALTTYSSNVHRAHANFPFELPRIAVGMSMTGRTFDLIRHGVIPMIRNRGRRVVRID